MTTATAPGSLRAGLRDSLPIVVGYVPACMTFGVVGVGLGLRPLVVFLLSALLYAGASQFVSAHMLAAGATGAALFVTVGLINLRYAVMSHALDRRIHARSCERGLGMLLLTEEVYAVAQYGRNPRTRGINLRYLLGLELLPYAATLAGTGLGIAVGTQAPQRLLPALNTSLYALLIAILGPQIVRSRRVAALCAVGAATSLLVGALAGSTAAILATIVTGTIFLKLTARADHGGDDA